MRKLVALTICLSILWGGAAVALTQGQKIVLLGSGGPIPRWVLAGAAVDFDFANTRYFGCQPSTCLSITRASSKTNLLPSSASGFAYSTFSNNVLAITPGLGLLIETSRTNQLLNSTAPVTQTTGSLGAATYTLWVNGSGSAQMSLGTGTGCGVGTATQGSPVNFTITVAGTCIVTVVGSLNAFQLEAGSSGTSLIVTAGAAATRASDLITLAGLAKTTVQAASFYAVSTIIGNAGVANSTGLLEENIDDFFLIITPTTMRSTFGATSLTATLGSGSFTTTMVKGAIGVAPSARSLVANNGTVVTDTAAISANTSFFVGSFGNGAGFPNAYFPRLTLGGSKPADAVLKGFTQ